MKLKDIKTLITSGTILVAVALYMIFGNPPPEKEETAESVNQNAVSYTHLTLPTMAVV